MPAQVNGLISLLNSIPAGAASLDGINIWRLCFTEVAHDKVHLLLSTCNYMFWPKTEGAFPPHKFRAGEWNLYRLERCHLISHGIPSYTKSTENTCFDLF